MVEFSRTRARVGLFALGLAAYWPQFPGMRDDVVGHTRRLAATLAPLGDLVDAGLVDGVAGARGCAALFRSADVDIVFCHLTTYSTSEPLLLAVRDLGVPIVLLNLQSVPTLDLGRVHGIGDWLGHGCTCAGLPEMTAALIRLGKRFATVTGYLDDPVAAASIADWCVVAGLRRRLNGGSMGLLGRPYPGMTDLYLDETAFFARFGVHTQHLNWDDIVGAQSDIGPTEQERRAADVAEAFQPASDSGRADIAAIAGILAALDRLVEDHRLWAIPHHYEGGVRENHGPILAASNPAFSILMAEGIACPVEGDIKVALAMTMLKQVAGTATLAELYSMDFIDEVCLIGHSGAADLTIAASKPTLTKSAVFHGKSGGGYLTQLDIPTGRVTLVSLTQGWGGEFRLVAAEGDVVDGPTLRLGDTNCRVRFPCGLRSFVDGWASYGPTHHGVMATGSHIDRLAILARYHGLPLDVVCR